jgi:tyrosine phenol-lyase
MIPPPWKIKVVEPIALPSEAERRAALAAAGFNTFLLRSEDVFVDLLTDSGTSALSQEQRAAMELGDEAYAGSRSFFRLERAMREVYGFRHLIPTHQGRGAEHLLARVLVQPGQLVPSNLYFTTSREHVELAGGVWADVSIPEASDPESTHPFKGNVDLEKLEWVLAAAAPERVAFVRVEACLNMAGGQPFSLENLRGVARLAHEHGVPLILDATRISENAVFVKDRERGYYGRSLPEIIREISSLAHGAVFSSKKDHFVPIGGFLAVNDDALAERARELVVVYEGFPHYGGLAGHDMEALAQGIRESTDGPLVRHYLSQSAYLGGLLRAENVPIVVPIGAHGVFLDAKRFLPDVPQEEFPAQALAAALYLAGGVRSMERGIVSGQHGDEPYDGLELVRLTIPRRVYTDAHLAYVAEVVMRVFKQRELISGLRMTYEPAHLRFFQARFEPRGAFLRPLRLGPLLTYDGNRTGRVVDDLVTDRAKHQAGESPVAAVADHDQVGVARLFEQHYGRLPLSYLSLALDRGLQLLRRRNRPLHDLVGAGAEAVERGLVECGSKAAAVDGRRNFPSTDDPQARFP